MLHDLDRTNAARVLSVMRLLRPHRLKGRSKIRVGRFFDGGYVMVDLFDGTEAAYSLGINDDVSWDIDIANRGIQLLQYDPTIDGLSEQHKLFDWKPFWIGGQLNRQERRETLESLIEQNGHTHCRNLVLKCDIEGAEWPLLQQTPNHVLQQFRQIVLELHSLEMLAQPDHADNIRRAFVNLTASHHVVHVHANNYAGWQVVGGIPIPAVLELTLARKEEGEFEVSQESFPTELDMPNNAADADLYLGQFAY